MHRTQLYFDETLFNQIKQTANSMNMTVSAYIREVLKKSWKHSNKNHSQSTFQSFQVCGKTKISLRKACVTRLGSDNSGYQRID